MRNIFKKYKKLIALLTILLIVVLSPLRKLLDTNSLIHWIEYSKNSTYFSYVFITIFVIGIILALPVTIFIILSGSIFGLWRGVLISLIGFNLGSQITFYISRKKGRNFVDKFIKIDNIIDRISKKMDDRGFEYMFYLRLFPIVPINMTNYISGLTKISYRDYTIATFMGKIPTILIYVYVSDKFVDFKHLKKEDIVFLVFVFILTITMIFCSYIIKKYSKDKYR